MADYTCNDCQKYDRNDLNRYDEGYCTYYCKYFPKSDRRCSNFELRNDINTTCFLTTAICDIFGFEDNCYGLNTMREFRDNILVKDSKYYPLLAEYEVVGPLISQKLYTDSSREEVSMYYFENYIYDIINMISIEKKYDEAVTKYVEMVNDLKRLYKIEKEVSKNDVLVLAKRIQNREYITKTNN